jgi:hypothetical protein
MPWLPIHFPVPRVTCLQYSTYPNHVSSDTSSCMNQLADKEPQSDRQDSKRSKRSLFALGSSPRKAHRTGQAHASEPWSIALYLNLISQTQRNATSAQRYYHRLHINHPYLTLSLPLAPLVPHAHLFLLALVPLSPLLNFVFPNSSLSIERNVY